MLLVLIPFIRLPKRKPLSRRTLTIVLSACLAVVHDEEATERNRLVLMVGQLLEVLNLLDPHEQAICRTLARLQRPHR